jgi:hypothetical protein
MLGERAVLQPLGQVVEPHLAVGLDVEQLPHRIALAPQNCQHPHRAAARLCRSTAAARRSPPTAHVIPAPAQWPRRTPAQLGAPPTDDNCRPAHGGRPVGRAATTYCHHVWPHDDMRRLAHDAKHGLRRWG